MSKVTVSLPDDLLRKIDDEAKRRSMSRSALLAAAARRALARRDPADVVAAVERSRARFARAAAFESAELIRRDRDGHQ